MVGSSEESDGCDDLEYYKLSNQALKSLDLGNLSKIFLLNRDVINVESIYTVCGTC